jgi:hypothetical protein
MSENMQTTSALEPAARLDATSASNPRAAPPGDVQIHDGDDELEQALAAIERLERALREIS